MTTIEKVARAIMKETFKELPGPMVDFDTDTQFGEHQRKVLCAVARAAIEAHETALRRALIEIDALIPVDPCACREEALRGLLMMIGEKARAALNEGKE